METWSPMMAIGKLSTAPMVAGTMMGGSGAQVSAISTFKWIQRKGFLGY